MEDRRDSYDGSRGEDYENRYNRFDGNGESGNGYGERSSQRRRFVRNDSGNRQYSKVERAPRQEGQGEGQHYGRPRQYRPAGERNFNGVGESEGRRYGQRDGYGQRDSRSYGYNRDNGGYRKYGNDQNHDQPHFYRERVQGPDGQQRDGGYRQNAYDGQQRPYRQRQNGGYGQQRRKPAFTKGKRIEYHESVHNPDEEIRLNKFLANAGVCSRREADDFIKAGVVKVNGETMTELGCKVKRGDNVLFHDQLVSIERKIYILLNKPKDCVTTVDDPQERKTVMDYVKGACQERIYPVGRLDRNTTGVLLLTNDGEMASKLTHPKYLKKKIYHARLDRNVSSADLDQLMMGVDIGDGDLVKADEVEYVNEDKSQVGIEIHSGRNRVVRRMFDALGYKVVRLDRVQFAGLTKKKLRRGDWRFLTEKEVNMLRMGAYE